MKRHFGLRQYIVFSLSCLLLLINCGHINAKETAFIEKEGAMTQKEALIKKTREQTELTRKGDLIIEVKKRDGKTAGGVKVKVDQLRHEFSFGTAISTSLFKEGYDKQTREKYLKILKENFNSAVHENALKWHSIEKEQGKFTYEDADKILEWCDANNIKMRGHCIFWEVAENVQPWLKKLSREELHLAVTNRAANLTERYKGRISEYDVNNEMLHGSFYRGMLGEDIWKEMFTTAHKVDPKAVLCVNDYNIMTGELEEDAYAKQIQELLDKGAPVGGIGIQGHFTKPDSEKDVELDPDVDPELVADPKLAVDPKLVERALNILSRFKLPIKITEFDIDSDDEQLKAEGLETLYRICFAHPQVKGILMWGFWEGAHWRPKAAIFKKDFSPTPSAEIYRKLVFDEWWTKLSGETDKTGTYSCRVFYGDHNITVFSADGKKTTLKTSLTSEEKSKKVEIVIE